VIPEIPVTIDLCVDRPKLAHLLLLDLTNDTPPEES